MKIICTYISLLIFTHNTFSQDVGINTTTPHASAILELNSFQKGLLIPRMLKAEREAITAPNGLTVFQTDGQSGFYYYQSATIGWKIIGTAALLSDNDNNTRLHVEKNPDENIVRGELDGVEYFNLQKNNFNKVRLEFISNENISIGDSSAMKTTTGKRNIAFGNTTLCNNTIGNDNIAFGNRALYNSKSDQNIAIGNETMIYDSTYLDGGISIGNKAGRTSSSDYGITIGNDAASKNYGGGSYQIAIGKNALNNANTTWKNIAIGVDAMFNTHNPVASSPDQGRNVAIGYKSMYNNVSGEYNIAVGSESGNAGNDNIGIGYKSLNTNTVDLQIGIGSNSLQKLSTGIYNTSLGYNSGLNLLSGDYNSIMGSNALSLNAGNINNTAFGSNAQIQSTGNNNTAVGYNAMSAANSLTKSLAVGANAMSNGAGEDENIAIGYNANIAPGVINGIAIGANAYAGTDNCIILGSVAGVNGATTTTQVGIGTSSPHESAILEVKTNGNYAFGLPTTAGLNNINNPSEGMFTYDPIQFSPVYFNGTSWVKMYKSYLDFTGAANKTLVYRNNAWQNGFLHKLKIRGLPFRATVEENTDDDAFRIFAKTGFETAQEKFTMKENLYGQLMMEFPNNSKNISLGQTDIQSGQRNIMLGHITEFGYGDDNIGIGNFLFKDNDNNSTNTISIGNNNLQTMSASTNNIGIGQNVLNYSTSSSNSDNVVIGVFESYINVTNVNNNVIIGNNIKIASNTTNATVIGNNGYLELPNTVILGSVPNRGNGTQYMNVGIGTTDPERPLHIVGTSSPTNPSILIENSSNTASPSALLKQKFHALNKEWNIFGKPDPLNNIAELKIDYNFSDDFKLRGNGDLFIAGTLSDNSDSILKKDIITLENVLPHIDSIASYYYRWKDKNKGSELHIGVLAQDVEKVFPQLVITDEDDMKSVNYPALNAVLVKALQELHHQADDNDKKISEQLTKLHTMKKKNEKKLIDSSLTSFHKK